MGEGGTPLVESRRLGPTLGIRLLFKLESLNPTGSYKDRIASVGAALAAAAGRSGVIATSSGNAGAAIAAYAARAALGAVLVVPDRIPSAKLTQIRAYGAVVITVRRILDRPDGSAVMFDAVMRAAERSGWLPMITAHRYAPAAMEGVKTIAFEIVETLHRAPERVYVPVGGGGLLAATWRGFAEARALGWANAVPRMVAVQPEGCSPLVRAFDGRPASAEAVSTAISGLQVSVPPDADLALQALTDSRGRAIAVSDEAIYDAQRRLAREEAIFAEPAGAAPTAGLLADSASGENQAGETVVCLITGTGFKDPAPLESGEPHSALDVDELDQLPEVAARLLDRFPHNRSTGAHR